MSIYGNIILPEQLGGEMRELQRNLRHMSQQLRRREEAGEEFTASELLAIRAITQLCHRIIDRQRQGVDPFEIGQLSGQAVLATRIYLLIFPDAD